MTNHETLPRELLQLKDPIIQVKNSLDALALLRMAEEFYTPEQRKKFYAELEQLKADAETARAELQELGKIHAGRKTDESRVAHQMAMSVAQQAQANVAALEKAHPLLLRLLNAKALLSL